MEEIWTRGLDSEWKPISQPPPDRVVYMNSKLFKGLSYEEIEDRHEQIFLQHQKTFEWLFYLRTADTQATKPATGPVCDHHPDKWSRSFSYSDLTKLSSS